MARQGHSFATAKEVRVVNCIKYHLITRVQWSSSGTRRWKTLGEIVTRGNIVRKEDSRDPEATAKTFRGRYFAGRDHVLKHLDRSAAILDRSKDLLISGSESLHRPTVPRELATHPDVLEVAVVARPHPRWGERAIAFVGFHLDSAKKYEEDVIKFVESLAKHAKKRLPVFAKPEWVEVFEALPKTSTGKIQKNYLRERVKDKARL
ncbi:hypothetical protein FRC04_008388 [Tulasnella sp. 424]|nr:hypothetical protein FRC04_008388 [Tulasnella sp. 424]